MAITTVLFDLDGTLLPMDLDEFTAEYFKQVSTAMIPFGYEPEKLVKSIWKGTSAMLNNDGSATNEAAFWRVLQSIYGVEIMADKNRFDAFYENEFDNIRAVCGFNPKAAETVRTLRDAGYRIVLATNPIFPAVATEKRMQWVGLEPQDFELYTTYENTGTCKPNLMYYLDLIDRLQVTPEECLMVGNDVTDDMVAQKAGMNVFLLTDCLINKDNEALDQYPHGSFDQLLAYIEEIDGNTVYTGEQ